MENLFLIILAFTQLNFIKMEQNLPLSNEKCFVSQSAITMIEEIKSMVTRMYECSEKQRADCDMRCNNDISDLKKEFAELRGNVTEISNAAEKQRAVRDNATLRNNDIISDLKTEIAELRAKVTEISNSTAKVIDNVRKIDLRLHLSEDDKVYVKDDVAYLISDKELTWSEAWLNCRRKDAILVNIQNSSVSRYLTSKLDNHDFWIGGRYESGVYSWRTESGYIPITWSNWETGEPNGFGSEPRCIKLWQGRGFKWDDFYCSTRLRFICSKSLI